MLGPRLSSYNGLYSHFSLHCSTQDMLDLLYQSFISVVVYIYIEPEIKLQILVQHNVEVR
jgi:hypothetical protein